MTSVRVIPDRLWYSAAAGFLGGFPDAYLVIDCESTGLDTASPSTLITQIGYALVLGRRIVDSHAMVLDWSRGPAAISADQYRSSIAAVTESMAKRGSVYRIDWPMVEAAGVEPTEALGQFLGLVQDSVASGLQVVGHNVYAYDRDLMQHVLRRCGMPFTFNVERMLDTGLLEKSRKSGWSPPLPGECSRGEWFAQVSRKFSREKWNLGSACFDEYGLAARIGESSEMAHDAGFDCVMTHHVLESMRERSERKG